jgi:hypothetical protein
MNLVGDHVNQWGGKNKSKDTVRKYSATLNNGKLRNCAQMCLSGKRNGTPFP